MSFKMNTLHPVTVETTPPEKRAAARDSQRTQTMKRPNHVDSGHDRLPFALYVRNDNRSPKLVKLIAACGPLDMDDPQPAITVMLPDEN